MVYKNSLEKLYKNKDVTNDDLLTVVKFVDTFCTVSLHPAIVGPIVKVIAEIVNQHRHTKTCKKYKPACRFKFPKLPSYKTIIAAPLPEDMPEKEKKVLVAQYDGIIKNQESEKCIRG